MLINKIFYVVVGILPSETLNLFMHAVLIRAAALFIYIWHMNDKEKESTIQAA